MNIHWISSEWTSQNSKRENRLRNLPCGSKSYPVVLEEEEGLKKGEDHVHNRYEHVQWSITLHPSLIFKDLGDSETIQNHSPCTETWMRKQWSNYWKSVSQPRSNYNLKISFKPSCFQANDISVCVDIKILMYYLASRHLNYQYQKKSGLKTNFSHFVGQTVFDKTEICMANI